MALCVVCDLSSIASEIVGKVFFKDKTIVLRFFPACAQAAAQRSPCIQDRWGPKNQSRDLS